jgi:hypothetical protein
MSPSVGSLFDSRRCYSERAAILETRSSGVDSFAPPRIRPFSAEPYRNALLARPLWVVMQDDVGLSPVNLSAIMSRRPRQTPRRSLADNRISHEGSWKYSQCFSK